MVLDGTAFSFSGVPGHRQHPRPSSTKPLRSSYLRQLSLPITEFLADSELSLPISPCMTHEQMEYVVECLNQFE